MKATQQLGLHQSLTITPQLQQSIKFLQMSSLELEQELIDAAEQNPLIQYEPPTQSEAQDQFEYLSQRSIPSVGAVADDDNDYYRTIADRESLFDQLVGQIRLLKISDFDKALVALLAGNLDEKGMLATPLDELVVEIQSDVDPEDGSPLEQLHRALSRLQHLEPAGVGARDLSESLQLQLENLSPSTKKSKSWSMAYKVCKDYLDLLAQRDFARLKKILKASDAELSETIALIKSLQHNPCEQINPQNDSWVIPEILIQKVKGQWQAFSNPDAQPRITLHEEYAKVIKQSKNHEGIGAMQQKLQEARWLVKNVLQRSETILKVAKAIVDRQQNFFNHGPLAMKPLILREIADTLGLHESTISRVTTQKFMATPMGVFELKYFFTSQLQTDQGTSVSSVAIRELIKQFIAAETKSSPLSDTQLSELLAKQGFIVARRTIAKYRDHLRIPAVHLRRN